MTPLLATVTVQGVRPGAELRATAVSSMAHCSCLTQLTRSPRLPLSASTQWPYCKAAAQLIALHQLCVAPCRRVSSNNVLLSRLSCCRIASALSFPGPLATFIGATCTLTQVVVDWPFPLHQHAVSEVVVCGNMFAHKNCLSLSHSYPSPRLGG